MFCVCLIYISKYVLQKVMKLLKDPFTDCVQYAYTNIYFICTYIYLHYIYTHIYYIYISHTRMCEDSIFMYYVNNVPIYDANITHSRCKIASMKIFILVQI